MSYGNQNPGNQNPGNQNPGDDPTNQFFFSNLLAMGSNQYQFFSFLGSVPFLVDIQYANFPQFGSETIVGGRPSTSSPTTPPISVPAIDDAYRPSICATLFCIRGSDGSSAQPLAEDPSFNTDEYSLSDMVPSPPKKKGERKMKAKKATAGEPSAPEEARPRRLRGVYTLAESMVVAECWVDIVEDTITTNNQDSGGFWGRIKARLDKIALPSTQPHKASDLRKHCEWLMRECGRFNAIYRNDMDICLAARTSSVSGMRR